MYNEAINNEWGTEVYPLVLKPTMKELQLSKGAVWINTINKKGKVVNDMGDRMTRWTGIKPKTTHFKMDLGIRKIGMNEIMVIQAMDDNSLNDYSRVVSLIAIPIKNSKRR